MNKSATSLIKFSNLCVRFGQRPALDNISGSIQPGTMTAIVGPNGAGKSTLLQAILKLITPSAGSISIDTDACFAYLPQQTKLNTAVPLSVFDTVAMGLWPECGWQHAIKPHQREATHASLRFLGLDEYAAIPISELSGGQLQRALFARVMMQKANTIMLDEPFNNLDTATAKDLIHVLEQWHQQGTTIIAVIHDLDIVRAHFDQTLLLARTLVASGLTQNVLTVDNLSEAFKLTRSF